MSKSNQEPDESQLSKNQTDQSSEIDQNEIMALKKKLDFELNSAQSSVYKKDRK